MRCLKMIVPFLFSFMLLTLCGCGSSSNGTASPFSNNDANSTTGGASPIFGNISTATGKTGITLASDRTTIDVNNGHVLVTAKLVQNGTAVSGVPVTFSIIEPVNGPATIDPGLATVTTDSNGIAVTRITTGNILETANVIVQGTGTISGQTATATTTFQIVRGGGVIMFTESAGLNPGAQINQLPPASENLVFGTVSSFTFLQQLPFKVTDSNGNPRVGVPVSLSTYNSTGATSVIISSPTTVVTDSAGQGIFNVSVTIDTPLPGLVTAASVVYQAVTNDALPVIAYIGGTYSLASNSVLTLSPSFASFGTSTDITLTVAGGTPPYTVTSSNTSLVTATILGSTITAHLVDTTAWTNWVTISVKDSASNSTSATLTR